MVVKVLMKGIRVGIWGRSEGLEQGGGGESVIKLHLRQEHDSRQGL